MHFCYRLTFACRSLQALQASADLAKRRAERCDAAEAEAARMHGEMARLRSEELRLRALETRFVEAQSIMEESEATERRLDHIMRRADAAEQRAQISESRAKSLELQLLTATTDLETSQLATQEAQEREASRAEELRSAEIERAKLESRLEKALQELSDLKVSSSASSQRAELHVAELNSKLDDSRLQCEQSFDHLKAERKKSQDAEQALLALQEELIALKNQDASMHAELRGLREEQAILREDLAHACAAREASEQRVAPLAAEASRQRHEASKAEQEVKSCRLEMEATRMAHYEQELL